MVRSVQFLSHDERAVPGLNATYQGLGLASYRCSKTGTSPCSTHLFHAITPPACSVASAPLSSRASDARKPTRACSAAIEGELLCWLANHPPPAYKMAARAASRHRARLGACCFCFRAGIAVSSCRLAASVSGGNECDVRRSWPALYTCLCLVQWCLASRMA